MASQSESPTLPDPQADATVQVVIVGAGPIGIETAIELQRRGIDSINIDRGPLGAQIFDFPPLSRWFSGPERISIGGVPLETVAQEKATREDYLAYLRSVVRQFDLAVRTFESVEEVVPVDDGFVVRTRTAGGLPRLIQTKSVVLAVGGTAKTRRLDVPGEDRSIVADTLGEPHRYFGRRVLVVGGKNSAADSAIRLWRAGADVTISYRGDDLHPRIKYWIRPELASCIRSGLITARFGTRVLAIGPNAVTLEQLADGSQFDELVDDVLLQIGFEADGSLFEALGCELVGPNRAVLHDSSTMETSIPGIYVAGTAVNGTQGRYEVYIENAHVHAVRIAAAMIGDPPPPDPVLPELPEA
jgi:thioredoxin reductase (NADPH)